MVQNGFCTRVSDEASLTVPCRLFRHAVATRGVGAPLGGISLVSAASVFISQRRHASATAASDTFTPVPSPARLFTGPFITSAASEPRGRGGGGAAASQPPSPGPAKSGHSLTSAVFTVSRGGGSLAADRFVIAASCRWDFRKRQIKPSPEGVSGSPYSDRERITA